MIEEPSGNKKFEEVFNSVFSKNSQFLSNNDNSSDSTDSFGQFEFNSADIKISKQNNTKYFTTNKKEEKKNEGTKTCFIVKKQRGRKRTKKSGKQHLSIANDNITIKIQVHFLTFVVCFLNDIIYDHFGIKNYFYQFAHSDKKKVNSKFLDELRQFAIRQIFETFKISGKYHLKFDASETNKNRLLLLEKNDLINQLLEMNYLDFFILYFNDKKPLKTYNKNGKIIPLSTKTKSFYYLNKKYKKHEEYFNEIIKMEYLDKIDLI